MRVKLRTVAQRTVMNDDRSADSGSHLLDEGAAAGALGEGLERDGVRRSAAGQRRQWQHQRRELSLRSTTDGTSFVSRSKRRASFNQTQDAPNAVHICALWGKSGRVLLTRMHVGLLGQVAPMHAAELLPVQNKDSSAVGAHALSASTSPYCWPRRMETRMVRRERQLAATCARPSSEANIHSCSRPCAGPPRQMRRQRHRQLSCANFALPSSVHTAPGPKCWSGEGRDAGGTGPMS